ncbi:hypothetical protein H8958_008029 [Nasalis larvatus]
MVILELLLVSGITSRKAATAAAIFVADEGPRLPSIVAVPGKRHSDLQGCRRPHQVLGCVMPHGDSQAAVGPSPKATGHADEHPAQTKRPRNNRHRKQPDRDQTVPAQRPPGRRLFPGPLQPSSPGSQPSSRCHYGATVSSQATQPGPALLSQASGPSPACRSRIALPGPALRRRASGLGPAIRRCTTQLGPALPRRATQPGPARLGRAPAPGYDLRSRATPPVPAFRRGASGPSHALQRHGNPPCPALRGRTARSSPARHSTSMTPGTVLRSRSTHRRSALLSRGSPPGSADENTLSRGAGLRQLVFQSSSGSSDPEVPRHKNGELLPYDEAYM